MAYCSLSDIEGVMEPDEIIELTNDDNRASDDIDMTDDKDLCVVNVNKCIQAAETEINTDLGARYKVPFTAVPDQVVAWCIEITIYQLFLRRRRQVMDEPVVAQYKLVKAQIKRVADGFGVLEGAEPVKSETGSGNVQGNKKVIDKNFTKNMLDKF